jgi:hypothetical protein
MGIKKMIDAACRHRGDRVQIVDVAMALAAGKVASSIQVPSCLDELLDMAEEAVHLERFVQSKGRMDVLPKRFVPYLRKETVHSKSREKIAVSQAEVVHFPYSCAVELGGFLEHNVFVAVVVQDDAHAQLELSVTDFARYLTLLRRLVELVTLVVDDNNRCEEDELLPIQHELECRICFANEQAMVLPCLHALCASCAKQWVDVHHDCPFCRQGYQDYNRLERNQWQVRNVKDARNFCAYMLYVSLVLTHFLAVFPYSLTPRLNPGTTRR